jgi:hypothetical protein
MQPTTRSLGIHAEVFVLKRPGMQLDVDGVRTPSGRWSTRGSAFLSNVSRPASAPWQQCS